MSVHDCAGLVDRGDPVRHRVTRAATPAAQARLWPLYAFNLEIARAPWVSTEPMIAQMRLQFWTDTLDEIASGAPVRAHEVATPLAGIWRAAALPVDLGHAMIAARHWDIGRAPFADAAALDGHIDATSGNLMWLAALSLGADARLEQTVRDMGYAMGLANWLVAVPLLEAAGRIPLVDGRPTAVGALARKGLARLTRARAARATVPAALTPVMLCGWQSGGILVRAAQYPARVAEGRLSAAPVAERGALMLRALTGRW